MPLILNLIQLSGQTSASGQDSSTCFTRQEREQIALQLIEGHECDTLLKVTELQLFISDTINKNLEKKVDNLDKINTNLQEELKAAMTIVSGQKKDIDFLTKENKKLQRKKNWITFGLGSGIVAIGLGFLIYAVTH